MEFGDRAAAVSMIACDATNLTDYNLKLASDGRCVCSFPLAMPSTLLLFPKLKDWKTRLFSGLIHH